MDWPLVKKKDVILEERFDGRLVKVYTHRDRDVNQFFSHTVSLYGEKEALVDGEIRLTYRDFARQVNNLAFALAQEFKANKGDRVALLLENCHEFCTGALAVLQTGAVVVPLNSRSLEHEQEFLLKDSGVKVLICDVSFLPMIEKIKKKLPALEHILVVGSKEPTGHPSFNDLLQKEAPWRVLSNLAPEDLAIILYTSGTTGQPKGAMITHFNLCINVINVSRTLDTTFEDRTLIAAPLFHVTGIFFQFLHMVSVGGTNVLIRRYKTLPLLELMEKEKITFFIGVPTMYIMMLSRPEFKNFDLRHWRIGAYGGSIMPDSTIVQLTETLPNLRLFNSYGATETTGSSTALPSQYARSHAKSVGIPFPTVECKIMDEQGREVPRGTIGEIWLKGPNVVKGYWNNPQATAAEITDGFWHSGDIGCVDEEGLIYLKDRKKDLINRGGEKIFSIELENVIFSHPKVEEVAVVGVPDELFGEQVKAVIVPKEGVTVDGEEIRNYVRDRLADFKVPKYVSIVRELPRNPGGKVIKAKLRDL
jgi:long-chain acyl-CoA synthetase